MLNPKSKIILSFVFCFLTGMIFGAAALAIDYNQIKFCILMLLLGAATLSLTVSYIKTVFKTSHIESELIHRINSIYTDID
jgi:FtsH-binding integral membrane protein